MHKLKLFLVLFLGLAIGLPAFAQSQARPIPKEAKVVDELASPPQVKDSKDAKGKPEPTITTRKEGSVTVSEYRVRGKLYQQKFQPESGPAYYLIDEKGDGKFTRVDGPDLKASVPMWVLLEW